MAAYIVVRIEVDEPGLLKDYQVAVPPTMEKYRGKFSARGGAVVTLEGPVESRRIVIIEFPVYTGTQAGVWMSAEL